ncbi:MAG: DNA ligase (ATP) [Parcubacteria group bacterium Gr01-1014_8]|nr:MAG: DNA ligase (ATP) [Parcubacteria group bacterium Gr01-1014_8]
MLATLIDAPFDDAEWVYETKWDGFRIVAEIKPGAVTLYSRNGQVMSERYKPVAMALSKIHHDAVIDGELVALDRQGVSRFQLLQNALKTKVDLHYCIFDVMFLDGKDLRGLSLVERKEQLKRIIPNDTLLRYSEHRFEHGTRYFNEAKKKKEEGIMAKRAESKYLSGKRSMAWLKIKTGSRQEVVIVGFTAPKRSRKYFGSLALAVHETGRSSGKKWRYVGHVGTGFDAAALNEIHGKLEHLRTRHSPFDTAVKYESTTTWVKPKLVGEVKFTEWTDKGEMRHPAFMGLREDKKPEEVVRE